MAKRTMREIKREIIRVLSDCKEHTYGNLERKVNTNWQTIRNHCEELKLFELITICKENKLKITKYGIRISKKL